MPLVLEGTELVGKTSLAKALHWDIVGDKSTRNAEDSYNASMLVTPGYTLWDRWWPTEWILGQMFNRMLFTPIQLWQLGLRGLHTGTVIMWLHARDAELRVRYQMRGDEHLSWEQVLQETRLYEQEMTGISALQPFMPNVYTDLYEALANHHWQQERRKELDALKLHSWGSLLEKRTLLIGDEPTEGCAYPFYTKTGRGCGNLLFPALTLAAFGPNQLHIINSMDLDGRYPDWKRVMEFFKPYQVIALGKDAAARLRKAGVHHKSVPHPSYWKRFKGNDIQGYANRFSEVRI